MDALLQYAGTLIGVGAVYGLIRADLKNLHALVVKQEAINLRLEIRDLEIDRRINDHIEHHHLRKQ